MKRILISIGLAIAFALLLSSQAAAPFASVAAVVPPAIGQPGVSLAFDTTNKLVVLTFQTANAAGVISTLTTISYNPRTLEGVNAGGSNFSLAGISVLVKHNLAADPLIYQVGNATAVLASCSTVTPVPAGQTACPTIPF